MVSAGKLATIARSIGSVATKKIVVTRLHVVVSFNSLQFSQPSELSKRSGSYQFLPGPLTLLVL